MLSDAEMWKYEPSQKILDLQQEIVDGLNSKQQAKVKELRRRFSGELKDKHNDFYLLKWLRARKFDLDAAENMLRSHLRWRKKHRVDYIHEEFQPPQVLKKYVPLGLIGEDKEGCPLLILWSGNIDIKGTSRSVTNTDLFQMAIYGLEYTEKAKIMQSEKHGKVISKLYVIFDMNNFQFQDFVWKPAYQFFGELLHLYEANYPETLKRGLIINVSKLYTMFFGMIKPFFSEDTAQKLTLLGKDSWKEIALNDINKNNLPKYWGGDLVDEIDGNPYCSSKIVIGGTIPKSYYAVPLRERDSLNLNKITVNRNGSKTVSVEVENPSSTLIWLFETEDHDMSFYISFCRKGENESECLIEKRKVNCFLVPEEGQLMCKESGTYSLVLDNTYSWYRSKKVYYILNVIPPNI